MNYVIAHDNKFLKYKKNNNTGYIFFPKNSIKNLTVLNESLLRIILKKRVKIDIFKSTKAINLMLDSDITLVSDCEMMEQELVRLLNKINVKYKKYFNEFEYFELIKDIYSLNMEILLKKKILLSN